MRASQIAEAKELLDDLAALNRLKQANSTNGWKLQALPSDPGEGMYMTTSDQEMVRSWMDQWESRIRQGLRDLGVDEF